MFIVGMLLNMCSMLSVVHRGANFGLLAENNVTGVQYWPNQFPNVIFHAHDCYVSADHEEITCLTDTGAGAGASPCNCHARWVVKLMFACMTCWCVVVDLRWLVSIANQDSAIISTSYAIPTIHSVRLASPSNPHDPFEMDTRGGEVVIIEGM